MSDSARQSPRAVIHKRILERAEANPEASIAAIANEISGASTELVERVLDQYGDPADDHSTQVDTDDEQVAEAVAESQSTDSEPDNGSDSEIPTMEFEDLSDRQQAVLRAIRRNPGATQEELAEQLDVSRATISNRVNAIDGFDWNDREAFVANDLDVPGAASDGGQTYATEDVEQQLTDIRDQLADFERRLEGASDGNELPLEDPELLAKVARACVADEDITEAEEVQILGALVGQSDD